MTITFVTGSAAKATIAADHLTPYAVAFQRVDLPLEEIQSTSVQAIAEHKARQAFQLLGKAVFVEDSGFGLDELGGYPGPQIKHMITAVGAAGVAHLADLTVTRTCTSTACLAYVDDQGQVTTFTNSRGGTVAKRPAGHAASLPLWTVYCPPNSELPLAAMAEHDLGTWRQWWAGHSVFHQLGRFLTGQPSTQDTADVVMGHTDGGQLSHPYVQAAAGLLIRDRQIVLVRQDRDGTPVWSPPGGGVECGELLTEAAGREVTEETGLIVNTVGRLAFVVNTSTPRHPSALVSFFEVTDWHGDIKAADPDITDCALIPFAQAIELLQASVAPRREVDPLVAYLRSDCQTAAPVYGFRDDELVSHV